MAEQDWLTPAAAPADARRDTRPHLLAVPVALLAVRGSRFGGGRGRTRRCRYRTNPAASLHQEPQNDCHGRHRGRLFGGPHLLLHLLRDAGCDLLCDGRGVPGQARIDRVVAAGGARQVVCLDRHRDVAVVEPGVGAAGVRHSDLRHRGDAPRAAKHRVCRRHIRSGSGHARRLRFRHDRLYPQLAGNPRKVVEGLGVRKSMRRSKTLAAGAKGRIFVLFLIIWALFLVAGVVAVPIALVMGITPAAPHVVAEVSLLLIGFASRTLVSPVFSIGTCLIYFDQRVRREAFDLEFLLGPEQAAAVPAAQDSAPPYPTPYAAPTAEAEPNAPLL